MHTAQIMPTAPRVIRIHAAAPPKPAEGQPCNGCGACCLIEPCPLGMLLTRRRQGACQVLAWSQPGQRYVCTALTDADRWVPLAGPPGRWAAVALRAAAKRWIAAGTGCDFAADYAPPPSGSA